MSNLVPKYDNWSSSTLFSRLVAAYDMILIKCPAPWSLMRLTTVTTPYEACNALLSINHFAKKLSLPVEDALGYVLFREAAKDLRKLLKANQEADVEDSYFVHFRALGLSPKITLLCDCGSLLLQSCASDRSVHGGPPFSQCGGHGGLLNQSNHHPRRLSGGLLHWVRGLRSVCRTGCSSSRAESTTNQSSGGP